MIEVGISGIVDGYFFLLGGFGVYFCGLVDVDSNVDMMNYCINNFVVGMVGMDVVNVN